MFNKAGPIAIVLAAVLCGSLGASAQSGAPEAPPCKFLPPEIKDLRTRSMNLAQAGDISGKCQELQLAINTAIDNLRAQTESLKSRDNPQDSDKVVKAVDNLQTLFLRGQHAQDKCIDEIFTKTDLYYQAVELTATAVPLFMTTFAPPEEAAKWSGISILVGFVRSIIEAYQNIAPNMTDTKERNAFLLNVCSYTRLRWTLDRIYQAERHIEELDVEIAALEQRLAQLALEKPTAPDLPAYSDARTLFDARAGVATDRTLLQQTLGDITGSATPPTLDGALAQLDALQAARRAYSCTVGRQILSTASLATVDRYRKVLDMGARPAPKTSGATLPALDSAGALAEYLAGVGAGFGEQQQHPDDPAACLAAFQNWVFGSWKVLDATEKALDDRWSVVEQAYGTYPADLSAWSARVAANTDLKSAAALEREGLDGISRLPQVHVGMSDVWHHIDSIENELFKRRKLGVPLIGSLIGGSHASPAQAFVYFEVESASAKLEYFQRQLADARHAPDNQKCDRYANAIDIYTRAQAHVMSAQDFCKELSQHTVRFGPMHDTCTGAVPATLAELTANEHDYETAQQYMTVHGCTPKLFASADARFQVRFPGTPHVAQVGTTQTYTVETPAHVYTVAYTDLSGLSGVAPAQVLAGAAAAAAEHAEATIIAEEELAGGARDVQLQARDGSILRIRFYVVGARLFQLQTATPPGDIQALAVTRFFSSFELIQ